MDGRTAILVTTILAGVLLTSGCRKDEASAPAPEPEQTEPEQTEPAPEPEEPTEPRTPDAAEAPPGDAGEQPSPDASGAVRDNADPEPEFAEGPLGDFERALHAVADCDKREGSIRVKDRGRCLRALQEARATLRDPSADVAPTPEERKRLREEFSLILRESLDHEDPTIVLYALMHNQADFDSAPATVVRLEDLMESEHREIAEWAAIARFWRRGGAMEDTSELAKETLAGHRHDRVRLAACQYLGDATFRGNREHFDLLLERARDGDEVALIRSCAVTRLGTLGSDEDIPTIAGFLDKQLTQYAAVFALQRGLRSEEAWDAYLDWFEAHLDDPEAIQWGTVTIFLPWKGDLDRFPQERAAEILEKLATEDGLHPKGRVLAVEHLATLGERDRLEKLRKKYDDPVGQAEGKLREAIDEALSK
ncbi:MAG: HEAT repeat domain-containing protein [Myxococcota bacterium]